LRITKVRSMIIEGNFDWVLVRIDSDEGLFGLGECYASRHGAEVKEFVSSLEREIVGWDPLNRARLTQKMGLGTVSGYKVNAISGIEIALWDLAGKALEVPIHRLLGGSLHDKVMIYADCHAGETVTSTDSYGGEYDAYTPEAYAANAKKIRERGYRLLKFDIYPSFPGPEGNRVESPLSSSDLHYCVEILESLREAIGSENGLAIDLGGDARHMWTTSDSIRLARAFEPYDLDWIEDPVPGTNVEALAEVTRSTTIPVLCSYTQLRNMRHHAREVIVRQAARMLAIDFGNIGGLGEGKKIADLAELYFMRIAPHNIASPVGTAAAAQASATMPNLMALEHHALGIPWWDDLTKEDPLVEEGYYKTNQKPGLGIELEENEVRRHLREGEEYF